MHIPIARSIQYIFLFAVLRKLLSLYLYLSFCNIHIIWERKYAGLFVIYLTFLSQAGRQSRKLKKPAVFFLLRHLLEWKYSTFYTCVYVAVKNPTVRIHFWSKSERQLPPLAVDVSIKITDKMYHTYSMYRQLTDCSNISLSAWICKKNPQSAIESYTCTAAAQ